MEELKSPFIEKIYEKNESNFLKFGCCSMQGWRARMEDSYINEINKGEKNQYNIFGIFDGHRGKETAIFVKNHFIEELIKNENFKNENIELSLKETFFSNGRINVINKRKKRINKITFSIIKR